MSIPQCPRMLPSSGTGQHERASMLRRTGDDACLVEEVEEEEERRQCENELGGDLFHRFIAIAGHRVHSSGIHETVTFSLWTVEARSLV